MSEMTLAEALQITRPQTYTSREVCALLRISEKTLQRRRKANRIAYTYEGGSYRYPASDVHRYMAKRFVPEAPASNEKISNEVTSENF
jgi:excisionase family DNA binding protein